MNYTLSEETKDDLLELIRDQMPIRNVRTYPTNQTGALLVGFVHVIGNHGGGLWDAFPSSFLAASLAWNDLSGACYAYESGGNDLIIGRYYPAVRYGVNGSINVWVTFNPTGFLTDVTCNSGIFTKFYGAGGGAGGSFGLQTLATLGGTSGNWGG